MQRKRIGIVSPACPYGHGGGHSARIRRLYEELSIDHDVWYFFVHYRHGPATSIDRKMLGDRLLEYPASLVRFRKIANLVAKYLRLRRSRPPDGKYRSVDCFAPVYLDRVTADYARKYKWDVVLVHYVLYTKAFKLLPDHVVKVIDSQDRFGDRFKNLESGEVLPWPWSRANMTSKEEGKGLRRADAVLAIQQEEAAYFRTLGVKKCYAVAHLPVMDDRSRERSQTVVQSSVIGYFGSNWAPNVHGLKWFIREVFPLVLKENPNTVFRVWGSACDGIEAGPGVDPQGFVEDVREAVSACRLLVCPVFLGSGLNVKAIEAMGWGLPLVGTLRTYRGLDIDNFPDLAPEDDPVALAARICRLLDDDAAVLKLSGKCYSLAENLLSEGRAFLEESLSN